MDQSNRTPLAQALSQAGGRTALVMRSVRERIAAQALLPGEKLPSIRRFATAMRVSPSTVVEAYDRLAAEGLIRARPGSGFFVAGVALPVPAEVPTPPDRTVDPFWVSSQALDASPGTLKPGCGWLPAEWMPERLLRRAVRALGRSDAPVLTDYGSTRGALNLRRILLRDFAAKGLTIGPDRLLLAASGTQAIDLVCRMLLRPGDAVLVDDPCYFNFQALLQIHRARVVGVPFRADGPDLRHFVEALKTHRPRLYVTNSALHNPTGATMAPDVAHRLLVLAGQHGLTIVEDDIFADLEPEPSPRLAVLDGLDRVIRVGSFSKTLSASIRCGFIAARPEWIEALADLQVAVNFGGPSPVAAELVAGVLGDGSYRKHLDGLRRRLSKACREAGGRLAALGIRPWIQPRGGFFLWCSLPVGVDATALARAALRRGTVLAPGNVFSPSQTAAGFMRFNVAQMAGPVVFEELRAAIAEAEATG